MRKRGRLNPSTVEMPGSGPRVPAYISGLLFAMVAAVPLLGLPDFFEGLRSGLVYFDKTRMGDVERASAAILYLREFLLFLFTVAVFFWVCLAGRAVPRLQGTALFWLCLGIGATVSLGSYPIIVPLAGLRQFMYLALLFAVAVVREGSPQAERRYAWAAVIVIAVEFIVSAVEIGFFADSVEAWLRIRVPGTFNNPNTLGVTFAILLFVALFLGDLPPRVMAIMVVLCIVGEVVMSRSRIGVLVVAFILVTFVWRRVRSFESRGMMIPTIVVFVGLMYLSITLTAVTGRTITVRPEEDPRVAIFLDQLGKGGLLTILFGRGLGVGTITLFNLGWGRPELESLLLSLDSTYSTLLVQFGVVGLLAFLFVFGILSCRCGYAGLVLFGVMLMVGFSGHWLEYYPFNLLAMVAYGMLWGRRKRLPGSPSSRAAEPGGMPVPESAG